MSQDLNAQSPSERTRVRRLAELARYDAATVHAIVDASYLCHIAFTDDKGTHNIPTACWREGAYLYVHGSNGGRLLKLLGQGVQACVAMTLLDGLVLARSAFNHSMNYRSVVIYGQFERVTDDAAKRASLALFMDKIAVGRQAQSRPGSDKEFAATTVMRLSLAEAACKVRSGGPEDDAQDMALPVWAGVLPLALQPGEPVADPACAVPAPGYVQAWVGSGPR